MRVGRPRKSWSPGTPLLRLGWLARVVSFHSVVQRCPKSVDRVVVRAVAGAYALYALAAVFSLPFVWALVRETRSKTLEQM